MRSSQHQTSAKLGGYFLIPHELFHIVGYRLVGVRCSYKWGDSYVTPSGSVSRRRRLVGLLFPFGVFCVITIVCGILSTLAYRQAAHGGFIFWTVMTIIAGVYAGTAVTDLRKAYLLMVDKPWYSWTPFDIFYWPVVDWNEVRKRVAAGEFVYKQD